MSETQVLDPLTEDQKQRLCLVCKRCCKQIGIPTALSPNDPDSISFYQERGYTAFIMDGIVMLMKEEDCPHLTDKGCDIYEIRPLRCREFDGREMDSPLKPLTCLWSVTESLLKYQNQEGEGDGQATV